MLVTVNNPDEFAKDAKSRGLSLEAYVQEILAQMPVVMSKNHTPCLARTLVVG
jgi:hypothetical protein